MRIDGDEVGFRRGEGDGDGDGVEFVDTKSVARVKLDLDIPEWLLVEVLVRLPVKQVFSLKLVSKQWRSVISDPFFIRMYVSRASMSRELPPWTYISFTMHVDGYRACRLSEYPPYELLLDICSRDFKCPSFYVLPFPQGHFREARRYTVYGVSNGLVLCGPCLHCMNYDIYNPITRQWIALPPHDFPFKFVGGGLVSQVDNGILTSYRAVRVEVRPKDTRIRFEVFFSEIGEWKSFIVFTDQAIRINDRRMPAILNGIMHWVTGKHGIMAYDPYHKPDSLRFITLPGDIDQRCNDAKHHGMIGVPSLCDAHQGRLRYFEMSGFCKHPHGFSSISVWILNDYSSGDWCLQHRVSAADILYDDILSDQNLFLQPISFHPFDSDILYLGYQNIIVSYNINSRKLKAHGGELGIELSFEREQAFWLWAFLFVIPPWPLYLTPLSPGAIETEGPVGGEDPTAIPNDRDKINNLFNFSEFTKLAERALDSGHDDSLRALASLTSR
ncbi:F-box protein [Sesamum alatum]|uniref:F-box protein n=1 Tax=Sesamum alatum TaxID=300844 RepID=A0AAE1Y658_9LAMI|nr:F-box protein [Sesamum alatum]